PSELNRRKIDKWSAAALPQSKATLQQGLPLDAERGAAGQFWTFTMSNSKALVGSTRAGFTPRSCDESLFHARALSRMRRGDGARQGVHRAVHQAVHARGEIHACVDAMRDRSRDTILGVFVVWYRCGPSWSLLPVWRRVCGPPPVSPVYAIR